MEPVSLLHSVILENTCLAAGRLSSNVVMTGNILLNGKKRRLDFGVVVSFAL